ncbi:hypothetical protein MAM1_0206d07989 [Mucor ambiguus]|uniref:GAF domain-containing protein n=1 Tax=Mucor ambiguus TaxID=91626 RepID=A0A0C9MXZ5_9FUNG|nr:hypothetical protein MAM1_0206d07989 [Mucor ambiguus]
MKELVTNTDPSRSRKEFYQELLEQIQCICEDQSFWVACTAIPFGKGVCGAAAATKQPQLVHDVHEFPGHIACDSASNSEVVIPLIKENRVLGVLDIDCEKVEGFTEEDKKGLQAIAAAIVDSCEWP